VERALASSGRPLEPVLRQDMEERFGHDFSRVRVHSGSDAEQSAREVNASAYTLGQNIVFGAGRFAPTTSKGQWLLAHELTHVMQQSVAATPSLQRKMDDSEFAKCRRYQKGAIEPCSRLSKEDMTRKIPTYDEKKHGVASPLFQPFLAIAIEPMSAHARFRLFRAVSCQLSPRDAVLVRDNFVSSIGEMSEAFDKLSTEDRCDLITLIDARIASGAKAEAERIARDIRREQEFSEAARQWAEAEERERKKRQLTPEQQWARDKELHAKAGRITWVDVLFPSSIQPYRIQYAWQIKDPVLKERTRLAEHGATISIAAAAADPIMRPIKAVIRFFECLIFSTKGGNLLSNRFGLKFAASFTVSFGPGVIVGATKEIAAIAKQIAHIIAHPIKFVEDLWNFLKLLWSPNSDEIACAMGQDMGKAATAEIAKLAKLSDLKLPYRLGEIAGPLILNTLIAIVAPEVVGALASTRIGMKLLSTLKALGDELKFLDKWRKRGKGAVKVEKDVAKAGRIEEVVGDAGKFVAEHKLDTVKEAANGLRYAEVGDTGHKVVEVLDAASPTGIACELQSPRPRRRVVCPPNMGSRKDPWEEFKARGGKVQDVERGPVPKVTEAEKVTVQEPEMPEGTHKKISNEEKRIKYVHDRGVEQGKKKAERDGLTPNNPATGRAWENPYEFDGPFGKGIDDIMFDKHGDPVILEYKGGTSELQGDQMRTSWVCRKIAQLRGRNDPMAQILENAMAKEKLTGRVYRTPIDDNGKVGSTFAEKPFKKYKGKC
jgi:hypothetical protein